MDLKKKSQISIQVIFYIMMSFIMVGLIIFGIQRIFMVQDSLSEQERIAIISDLESTLSACADPINRGSMRTIELKSNLFNGICIIGSESAIKDAKENSIAETFNEELSLIKETGDNVVLVKTSGIESEGEYKLSDFAIIDSFQITRPNKKTVCKFNTENSNIFSFSIQC